MNNRENEIKILENEYDLLVEKQKSFGIAGNERERAKPLTKEVSEQWHDLEKKKKDLREKIDLLHKE